jgi:hypothetical protein
MIETGEGLESGICKDLESGTCEALKSGICEDLKSGTCEALKSGITKLMTLMKQNVRKRMFEFERTKQKSEEKNTFEN